MSKYPPVAGFCPLGCGETLFLGVEGHVTCRRLGCEVPDAVSTLLAENETDHIVQIWETSWSAKHPLRERLGDGILVCDLQEFMSGPNASAMEVGRYRARFSGGDSWKFIQLS